jgi:hypothetical protein
MMFVSLGIGVVMATVMITLVSVLTPSGKTTTTTSTLPPSSLVGRVVATTALTLIGGPRAHHVASFPERGQASVLFFFSSTCTECQVELPRLAKWIQSGTIPDRAHPTFVDAVDVTPDGLALLSSSKLPSSVTVVADPAGDMTTGKFGFIGVPYTVFVNRHGVVTSVVAGAVSLAKIQAGLRTILG